MSDEYIRVGDSIGVCEVTHLEPTRLRVANSLILTIVAVGIGVVTLAALILLSVFRVNLHLLFLSQSTLIFLFFGPLACFALAWFIGHSFDFDTARDRVEYRKHYRLASSFPASSVAELVLSVRNKENESWIDLKLRDGTGKKLLERWQSCSGVRCAWRGSPSMSSTGPGRCSSRFGTVVVFLSKGTGIFRRFRWMLMGEWDGSLVVRNWENRGVRNTREFLTPVGDVFEFRKIAA